MATTNGCFGRISWRSLVENEWLVYNLAPFFEDGGFEIHSLWLLALEDDMVELRTYVEDQCDLSVNHARNLAMMLSMWTALLKLPPITGSSPMGPPRLHVVLKELQQLNVPSPHHPHRRLALWSMISGLPQSQGGVCSTELSHSPQPFVMYAAARRGHLESVVWLHHFSDYDQARVLDEAALHGETHVIAWLLGSLLPRSDVRVDLRIRDDPELGVMAWRTARKFYTSHRKRGVIKSRVRYSADTLAAECGDLGGVRKLLDHALFGPLFDFRVIKEGILELVRWFVEVHNVRSTRAFSTASQGPSVDVLEYIYEAASQNGVSIIPVILAWLTTKNRDILLWLHHHGFHQRLLQRNALDHVVTIEQDCSEYQRTLGMCEHDPRAELSDILRRRHMEGLMRSIVLFRRFVGMLIDVYDPAFLRRVTWLPMWALRQRSLVSLERLAEIGHPAVLSPKLFRRLLVQYRNDSIVRWYIEKQPELISTREVQWV
jgi:hypothetical protein